MCSLYPSALSTAHKPDPQKVLAELAIFVGETDDAGEGVEVIVSDGFLETWFEAVVDGVAG